MSGLVAKSLTFNIRETLEKDLTQGAVGSEHMAATRRFPAVGASVLVKKELLLSFDHTLLLELRDRVQVLGQNSRFSNDLTQIVVVTRFGVLRSTQTALQAARRSGQVESPMSIKTQEMFARLPSARCTHMLSTSPNIAASSICIIGIRRDIGHH